MPQQNYSSNETTGLNPKAPLLGELGSLQTRLARCSAEVRAAQALRYEVFYNEMGGRPNSEHKLSRCDKDAFDQHCDHLLVIDASSGKNNIVGTYRMLLQSQAHRAGGFYTQLEYDLEPLFSANSGSRFMELGRSCILPGYRNKRTMELLWHGTWTHALAHNIDIMFGCASFKGTDPHVFADTLSWLGNNAVLDNSEDCRAVAGNGIVLADFANCRTDMRAAMAGMPPLIKGYLRLGAKLGSQAVIDHQFGTTDVLVVLKVAGINPRYLAHFGADASRFLA